MQMSGAELGHETLNWIQKSCYHSHAAVQLTLEHFFPEMSDDSSSTFSFSMAPDCWCCFESLSEG